MKNKVIAAMGIGIAAVVAPVALNGVEAKADVDPYLEELQKVKQENAETVAENEETVEENQDIQDDNADISSTDNAESFEETDKHNDDVIADQPAEVVDDTKKDDLDKKAKEVEDVAASLDDINKDLEDLNQKLTEAEEKLQDADENDIPGYNKLVDEANDALDEYNDKLYKSIEASGELQEKADEYNSSLSDLEDSINDSLDKKAVDDAQKENQLDLSDDSNVTKENADILENNEDVFDDNSDDLNTSDKNIESWNKNLIYDPTTGEKYVDLMANAKKAIDDAKASMDAKKGDIDAKKAALDAARDALSKIVPGAGETKSDAYNKALGEYQALEEAYNALVEEYNGLQKSYDAATQNYSTTLSKYADAQNKYLMESGISDAKNYNLDSNTYNTVDELQANDGKKISDLNEYAVDSTKVLSKDAGTVSDVTDAIGGLNDSASALQDAATQLGTAETGLKAAMDALAAADPEKLFPDEYNQLVTNVEDAQKKYIAKVNAYNTAVSNYNGAAKDLVSKYNTYLSAKYDKEVVDVQNAVKSANEDIIGKGAANNAQATGQMATFEANDTVLGVNASALDVNAAGTQMAELKVLYDVPEFETVNSTDTKADLWNNLTGKADDVNAAKASLDDSKSAVDAAKNALLAADAAASNYGDLVAAYNSAVASYNDILATYNNKVAAYNSAADGFVDAYNTWCEAQSGKYNEEQKKVITPLQALETARGAADGASSINNVNPSTILNDNISAISDFETKVKKAYLDSTILSKDQIDAIYNDLFKANVDELLKLAGSSTSKTGVLGTWDELNKAASDLNDKAAIVSAADRALDEAASNNALTESEFKALKDAYNNAAKEYNDAVEKYQTAKTNYDDAVAKYNLAKERVGSIDLTLFTNASNVEEDFRSISLNENVLGTNFKKLGIDGQNANAAKLIEVLTDKDSVTKPYDSNSLYELEDAVRILIDGMNNQVEVEDNKFISVTELQSRIKAAATALNDEDGATDADVAAYNKLIKTYTDFIAEYNKANSTFAAALDNYIGKTVSQYTDAEKKDNQKLTEYWNDHSTSDHVDVKICEAVSLNEDKTAVNQDSQYTILGVYASEDLVNTNQYGITYVGKNNLGKTVSGQSNLHNSGMEFTFFIDWWNQLRFDKVYLESATFWVKYQTNGGAVKVEKFSIDKNDRFKDNSWYSSDGDNAGNLQAENYGIDTVKIGEKTYYNISGYSVFEISKRICTDGSGTDLVLNMEVLQSIREKKELDKLSSLDGALKNVDNKSNKNGLELDGLSAALGASGVGLITNDVYNNPYGDPGEKKADPDDLAGLKNVTGAVTPVDISNLVKGKKVDPTALLALSDPTFKPDYKKVSVDPVSGEINLDSPDLLNKISADELKRADFKPIELKPFGFSFTRGSFVSPFHQLKSLPTRPVTPPGENPPEEPPTENPPTVVPPTVVPPTVTPPVITPPVDDVDVLGAARGSSVLGARRSMAPAVLGKRRRPTTGDSMAMVEWALALSASVGGAAAATAGLKKSKKEEDEE